MIPIFDKTRTLLVEDLGEGFRHYPIWIRLSQNDILARYRRTTLGPLWLSLSTGIAIAGIGIVWSIIFNLDVNSFFPYLTAGIIIWQFLSSAILESGSIFTQNASIICSKSLPLSIHAYRMTTRNFLIFLHNFPILVLVIIIFNVELNWSILLVLPSIIIFLVNIIWAALLLGTLSARHRDIPAVLSAMMTLAFLLTPVMWQPEMLGNRAFIADFNPLTHFLNILREPLLGHTPSLTSWIVTIAWAIVGWIVTILALVRYKRWIPFWI